MRRVLALAAFFYVVAFLLVAIPETQGNPQHGRDIFRYDTFGDEQLWTTFLRMNEVVGAVRPIDALDAGLKVDADALPPSLIRALKAGNVNLEDPAVTVRLLELNAVVGLRAKVTNGQVETVGITCALCHSTVDNSLTAGVGRRLDGWPNRDLNVGGIIAMSPALNDTQRGVFNSWGRGKYDPRLQAFDGDEFRPLNETTFPVVIPPAYGLRDVGFETFTGDGPVSYWNNYVGVTQMGGHGDFNDPRMPLSIDQSDPDLVTPKLAALFAYQRQLKAPAPPKDSYNFFAARRGERVFNTVAGCAECHIAPTYTDVMRGSPLLHDPDEVGAETEYASRSVTKQYRTSPLRGIWQHPPYFHDGSAPDLSAVIARYESARGISLTPLQRADLIEFLKSL
jgi:mono/diheme cytochrome c family protein